MLLIASQVQEFALAVKMSSQYERISFCSVIFMLMILRDAIVW